MTRLSVVIITHNEEKNIGRCLESVKSIPDDIVVVDSFSTDRTADICKQYGVRFLQHQWEGYSATKNFANAHAINDWILSIDADESLSDELQKSINSWMTLPAPAVAKFSRLANYCGKWVRHGGWYPDIKVRIFNRNISRWDGLIHETLTGIDEKKALLLRGDCYHYTYYSVEEHIGKTVHFYNLAAENMFNKGKKANLWNIYSSPFAKFIRDYFLRFGFLDGRVGYTIARISARSTALKYRKLRELWMAASS